MLSPLSLSEPQLPCLLNRVLTPPPSHVDENELIGRNTHSARQTRGRKPVFTGGSLELFLFAPYFAVQSRPFSVTHYLSIVVFISGMSELAFVNIVSRKTLLLTTSSRHCSGRFTGSPHFILAIALRGGGGLRGHLTGATELGLRALLLWLQDLQSRSPPGPSAAEASVTVKRCIPHSETVRDPRQPALPLLSPHLLGQGRGTHCRLLDHLSVHGGRASRAWSQCLRPPRPQAWPQTLHRRCRSES